MEITILKTCIFLYHFRAKENISALIQSAANEGATIMVSLTANLSMTNDADYFLFPMT